MQTKKNLILIFASINWNSVVLRNMDMDMDTGGDTETDTAILKKMGAQTKWETRKFF